MNSCKRGANDAFSNEEEENSRQQRRRIEEVGDDHVVTAPKTASLSLTDLNDNVLVKVMSFLTFPDLNEVAMSSRRCREIRSHESLDQTRVGTIVLTENTTLPSFYNTILEQGWNDVFSGNRTHLRVVGLERLQCRSWTRLHLRDSDVSLAGVVKLDVSCSQDDSPLNREEEGLLRERCTKAFLTLIRALPNVRELDASHLKLDRLDSIYDFGQVAHLERITWTGCCDSRFVYGYALRFCSSLTELNLDGYHVKCDMTRSFMLGLEYWFMWKACKGLERLSMKNATWICNDMSAPEPLPQEMLINMVRRHPTLRWLRSDLTAENVAMLKQEKPEITFITD